MTLRTRVMVALIALSAITAAVVGWWAYGTTRNQLDHQIDQSLSEAAISIGPDRGRGPDQHNSVELQVVAVQELDQQGSIEQSPTGLKVPVTAIDVAIANGSITKPAYRTITIGGAPYRLLTTPEDHGGAYQLLRSLSDRNAVLSTLRWRIIAATALVVIVSAACGWLLARQLTRRLRSLAVAVRAVEQTGRLDVAVPAVSRDETGELTQAFQHMLASLGESRSAQQRLVQDAGHELRTPLTSLRTNLAILERYPQLPEAQRDSVLSDLRTETLELTELLNEIIALSMGNFGRASEPQPIELGAVVARSVARARRRFGRDFAVEADASVVDGRPGELERAVSNLLENAVKFSPPDGHISIEVKEGAVVVRFEQLFRAGQLPGPRNSGPRGPGEGCDRLECDQGPSGRRQSSRQWDGRRGDHGYDR